MENQTKTNFQLTFAENLNDQNKRLIKLTTVIIDEILYSKGYKIDDGHSAKFSLYKGSESVVPRIRENSEESKNISLTDLVRVEESVNLIIRTCMENLDIQK